MRETSKQGADRLSGFSTLFSMPVNRMLRRPLSAALLTLCMLAASAVEAVEPLSESLLNEISALTVQGVDTLPLLLLAEAEPDLAQAPAAWAAWHRKKIELLRQKEAWQAIIREYERLPVAAPHAHRDWLFVELVRTYLTMGSGAQARDLLLSLIWDSEHDTGQLAQWRRLVAQSYLVDGRYDDARSALLRYEQDYPEADRDPHWLGLQARLLIAGRQANEAAILALASDAPAARSAYVLARLETPAPPDDALINEAFDWLAEPSLDLALKHSLFSALFEGSRQMRDWPRRIAVLERLLGVDHLEVAQVTAVVDALWFSLTEYGRQLANREQLLVGNYGPWFELAAQLNRPDTRQAEAVYAWLAIHAEGEDINARAHQQLVQTLAHKGETELLRSLYLSSSQFTDVSVLPLALMYRLVDMALAAGDLGLASKLMSGLDAPEGVDVVEWQLRRARVQILAGTPQHGAERLRDIVAADTLGDGQIGNLLLALQDLNHQGGHQAAYEILAELVHKVPDSRRQGELYFWMGESRRAQQRYSAAARLYLRAARTPDERDSGWQTLAQQRAAEMLEQAGLVSDAVLLYKRLQAQADPARRALYQDQIRRLSSQSD